MTAPRMPFVYDDGGRKAAGFTGRAGDCVVRAVAIALQRPYREVYDALSEGVRTQRVTRRTRRSSSARDGLYPQRKWFRDYMAAAGWEWVPTMQVGQGCKVHLVPDELPSGRLIVAVSRHYTAVIDKVIHDTHDSQRTTFWYRPGTTEVERVSERCVYGYWRPKVVYTGEQEGGARTL